MDLEIEHANNHCGFWNSSVDCYIRTMRLINKMRSAHIVSLHFMICDNTYSHAFPIQELPYALNVSRGFSFANFANEGQFAKL